MSLCKQKYISELCNKNIEDFRCTSAPNLCRLQPPDAWVWSHTGQFVSVVVSLMLVGFVFGVESLQQGSQDAPWDLLMCVYQRLDCLLHLQSKNTNIDCLKINVWWKSKTSSTRLISYNRYNQRVLYTQGHC